MIGGGFPGWSRRNDELTFMTSSHFNFRRGESGAALRRAEERRDRAWAVALALLALASGFGLWAQNDSPITIMDGSLTIESAVPWARFSSPDAGTRVHPEGTKAVTKVAITMPGHNQTVTFSGQKCTVAVRYASTDITFTTGNNGRGLRMATDFSSFQPGATANHLEHRNRNAKISRVTVTQGSRVVFDNAASGGTKIVISYQ